MAEKNIKSMKLYNHVDRAYRELEEVGIDRESPLSVEDLQGVDQWHYHGHDAVARAAELLNLGPDSRVAEVGSGMGGPARFLADKTGCHVTALELQPDLNDLAIDLTARCSLGDRVTHLCGDVLDGHLAGGRFDAVVSWLALYHIADRDALFAQVADAIKPGGGLYVEDIGRRGAFTPSEKELLEVMLFGQCTPTQEEYRQDLAKAGFDTIEIEDMTADWSHFTNRRLQDYRAKMDRHERVQGPEVAQALDEFYGAVDNLFQGGNLAGFRITAQKS